MPFSCRTALAFLGLCVNDGSGVSLQIVPVTFAQAKEFVKQHHRHHKPPIGHKFSIGVALGGQLVGVAMAGRPVARSLDDGLTLEVNRTCTDGTSNANSMLYGAVVRAAKAMGYKLCLTYIQEGESGASLRAAGWVKVKEIPPRQGWDTPSRPREDNGVDKVGRERWEWRATGKREREC
jgi:hypothetical protein